MPGSFTDAGELDTSKGMILVFQGKKRSGKSLLALYWFMSFPGDKAVIDIAKDDGPVGPGVYEITGTVADMEREWPEHARPGDGIPMIVRYKPDANSPTFYEDVDAFIGMVMAHSTKEKPVMILIHEMGVVAKANRTKPHARAMLMHNRHAGLNCLFCQPRAMDVEPLVLAQADLVFTFEMPNEDDRKRTASTLGIPLVDVTEELHDLGPNEYTRFDANLNKPEPAPPGVDVDVWEQSHPDYRFIVCKALPPDVVAKVQAWAANVPEHADANLATAFG